MTLLAHKLYRLLCLPGFVLAWLAPLWLLLGVAKLLVFTVPMRRLAPHLGRSVGLAAQVPLLDTAQERRARLIGQAVQTAARYTPWASDCYPQAIVARWLLGLYGIPYALCFGLARDPVKDGMLAHAWVAAGRVRVTGGAGFGRFTVVNCFVAPARGCT